MDRTVFEAELREQGYGDVVDRRMQPDTLNPEHAHDSGAILGVTSMSYSPESGEEQGES